MNAKRRKTRRITRRIKTALTLSYVCLSCPLCICAQVADTLTTMTHKLQEVVVSNRTARQRVDNVQIGQEKISIDDLNRMPTLMGERDIIKSLQLLAGVKTESESSSGFQVRGGRSTQNNVILDNASIYQSGHLMGLFSSFNSDALNNATLYKGMIPAQYGEASSSVLDIATRSGNMEEYHFGGTLGLLSIKGLAEGPIVKDKLCFLVSARRSYADLFLKASPDYSNMSLYFYDINAKLDWKVNNANRLSLSFFHGKDVMEVEDFNDMDWQNSSLTLKWMHYYGEALSSTTSAYVSNFVNDVSMTGLGMDYTQGSFIHQYGLNHNFRWNPREAVTFKMGAQSVLIDLCSAKWTIGNTTQREQRKAWENSVWANCDWKIITPLTLSAGVRLNMFSALGGSPYYDIDAQGKIVSTETPSSGSFYKTYLTAEPRLSLNYKINEQQSIKLGYSHTAQNIHAIQNNNSMMIDNRYCMSSNLIKPEKAHQASLGYNAMTADGAYDFSIEGYYKTIQNVYDYRDGKSLRSEIEMERLILGGKSRAYGMEFTAHKNKGRLTGWLNYTLSWSQNKIDGINDGKWYTANNDRRHDITIVGMYKINDRWDISSTWKYNTGQAITAPAAKYMMDGKYYYYFSERNGYRAPAYHRLDVSANHTTQYKRHTGTWSFGIYNLYNQKNPFNITFKNDSRTTSGVQAYKFSLFGIIPTVSYSIKY